MVVIVRKQPIIIWWPLNVTQTKKTPFLNTLDSLCNALVICNHAPPPPPPEGGAGVKPCFYFLIVPAVRGKCQGFVLYRPQWQCNENITDCGGKRAVVLPTGCPGSAGLLAGICRTKVKVPAIPRGWGGAVVTND